jgi:hypothetical protein
MRPQPGRRTSGLTRPALPSKPTGCRSRGRNPPQANQTQNRKNNGTSSFGQPAANGSPEIRPAASACPFFRKMAAMSNIFGYFLKFFRPPPPRSRTKTIPIRRKSAMCPGSHILIRAASIVGQPCSNRENPWAHFQPRDFHARRRWAGRTGRQREAPGAWVARGRREQAWQRHRSDRTGPGGPQVRPTRPSAAPATSPNSKRIWISAKRCAWPVTVFESNPALRSNAWM